jgi:hypothetical protein
MHLGGVTRNAVIGIISRMGLLGKRPKTHKSQDAIRLRRNEYQRSYRAKNGNPRPRRASPAMHGHKARASKAAFPSSAVPALPPLNLSIIDVARNQCKFMAGNDHLCCGHSVHADTSWCPSHYRVVYGLGGAS